MSDGIGRAPPRANTSGAQNLGAASGAAKSGSFRPTLRFPPTVADVINTTSAPSASDSTKTSPGELRR
eukprot:15447527-Alexandrium_andersonii.AAC.1